MAMVSADGSSQSFGGLTAKIGWFGLRVGGHPALSLHSSNEPCELSQWLRHDDSTINIVVVIIIIIIIIKWVIWWHSDLWPSSSCVSVEFVEVNSVACNGTFSETSVRKIFFTEGLKVQNNSYLSWLNLQAFKGSHLSNDGIEDDTYKTHILTSDKCAIINISDRNALSLFIKVNLVFCVQCINQMH